MAMDLEPKGSFKADINVTPLVDVMLVLLIIMMLIAPMLGGVTVALPEAGNGGEKPDTQKQTVVAVDSHDRIYVDALLVTPGDLVPRVQRALDAKKDKLVYLKGDKDAKYSAIMAAMDALRTAQIEDIALITERKHDRGERPSGERR